MDVVDAASAAQDNEPQPVSRTPTPAHDRQVVVIEEEEPIKVQLRHRPNEPAIGPYLLVTEEINRHHTTVMTASRRLASIHRSAR